MDFLIPDKVTQVRTRKTCWSLWKRRLLQLKYNEGIKKCTRLLAWLVLFALVVSSILQRLNISLVHSSQQSLSPVMEADKNNVMPQLYVKAMGGIGNNLFQWCYGYATAKRNNVALVMPQEILDLLYIFPALSNKTIVSDKLPKNVAIRNPKGFGSYDATLQNLPKGHNISSCCYMQSWKYFSSVSNEVANLLQFQNSAIEYAKSIIRKEKEAHAQRLTNVPPEQIQMVGIHLRRGDYLGDHRRLGFVAAPAQYFDKARDVMRSWFTHVHFIVVTSELNWKLQNIVGDDVTYAPTAKVDKDLALLAHCDHVIISVGTFGWWGAWLAQRRDPKAKVIFYQDILVNETTKWNVFNQYKEEDYQCKGWTPIGNKDF